jgi:hypothetical protein
VCGVIRWVLRFPGPITAAARHYYREALREASESRRPIDLVLEEGAVLERAPAVRRVTPAFVRRARARARQGLRTASAAAMLPSPDRAAKRTREGCWLTST